MRLFDKVCISKSTISEVVRQADAVLAVDTIAQHVFVTEQLAWQDSDLPHCVPPWETCFVEFDLPRQFRDASGIRDTRDIWPSCQQIGMLSGRFNYEGHNPEIASALLAKGYRESDVFHAVNYNFFVCQSGAAKILPMLGLTLLRKDGQHLVSMMTKYDEAKIEQLTDVFNTLRPVLLLSFNFANCKNVTKDDATEELQPPAKIRRRMKLPEVKRYTLNICGHATFPHRDGTGEPQEGIMPFHLCRGHFATYTADKPLFGNPKNVGRFWIPPHTKGKKERGEIIKDYAIAE